VSAARPELNRYAWQKLRAKVKARDRHGCIVCGATTKLSVHHIVPARYGGSDTLDNLVTLCSRHHRAADRRTFRERGGVGSATTMRTPQSPVGFPSPPESAGPWSRAW
jgi:5-methylcytosine-specific restriction endonuclease McrA